jgi:hypothetical protein
MPAADDPSGAAVAVRCLHLSTQEPWPVVDAQLRLLPPDDRPVLLLIASYRGTLDTRRHPGLAEAADVFAERMLTGASELLDR